MSPLNLASAILCDDRRTNHDLPPPLRLSLIYSAFTLHHFLSSPLFIFPDVVHHHPTPRCVSPILFKQRPLDKILAPSQMSPQLLPATAAAFAPRASSVNVVLGSEVELWLTRTLKRINRAKRPLNSVLQHRIFLTEKLSSKNAIWTLTSIMLSKAPESDLRKDSNPLIEALFNFQLIHIKAYTVHVDMVLRNEVVFKLTPETIEALVEYHKEIHCVDVAASTYNWLEKDLQIKELHEKFNQAINKFVYRTNAIALEGLEEEGAGELLCGKSEEVKNNIMNLFLPLFLPTPKAVGIIRPRTPLPTSTLCPHQPAFQMLPLWANGCMMYAL
ncbi:hypothetical protein VE03_10777 [Pseudogymnoascus sp. 23342-1-I1]|nr:hypothetical protein VE03_10777 [Pseudogymnoascus sp. 23342-1-I1]